MKAEPSLHIDPRLLLQRELERRCQSNPRYSLRAFAKALEISPAVLSLVLTGKRQLSRNAARKVIQILSLPAVECAALINWANTKPSHRKRKESTDSLPAQTNTYQMSLDSFAVISDWFHLAILSLLEIPDSRFDAKWIARQLGITEIEAKSAMERLKRMEIIEKVNGRWKQVAGPIRIGNDVPTAATKKFQRQLLLKAIESIENDPVESRDFSSMTIAMDQAQIPYARDRIRKFRRELAEELEARGVPTCVYKFTVQIFPVSKFVNKEEKSR